MAKVFADPGSRRSPTTVSITAFRSMLDVKASKVREKQNRSWYFYCRRFLSRDAKNRKIGSDLNQLRCIPDAAMTGILIFSRVHLDSQLMGSGIRGHDDAM